jgi:YceI-like domain
MKRYSILFIAQVFLSIPSFGQLFSTQTGETSFFSETPVENIVAINKSVGAMLNTATNEIAVGIKMASFDFPNRLMKEHFNENYVESEKYPTSMFKGKITEAIDYAKNGTYNVTAKGQLILHGVAQPRELRGTLTVEDQKITLVNNFDIKLVDHKIDVPKLVFTKVAEVIAVKSKYVFNPYVKK